MSLITLITALVGNVRANEVHFEYQIVEFSSTGTQPNTDAGGMYYQQDLLWTWYDGGEIIHLSPGSDGDFVWSVTTTGDLEIPNGHYISKSGHDYIVNPSSKIYFAGNSGTLKVTATNPDFGGVTYSCSYTISYHMDSKKWDFYGHRLAIGRMKDDGSSLHSNSSVWTLTSVSEGAEKVYFYKNSLGTSQTPVDVSVISETNGLKFYAPAECFGLYNESDNEGAAEDRFIALKPGAEVVIPSSQFSALSNPRIRIKMGRYGGPNSNSNEIDLTIVNGKDALGQDISGDGTYVIGGSAWWGGKKDYHQRGEYHFQIQDKEKDFKIKVHAGQWLKLYTIEVYNSTEMLTENSILGDSYQLLNKGGVIGNDGVTGTYYLHYRGKGEHTRVYTNIDYNLYPTGTVECNASDFTNYNGGETHTYKSKIGQFGTFRIRLACYTLRNNYCTDFAYRTQSVGYIKPKEYPYTWDFTDVNTYSGGEGRMGTASTTNPNNYGEGDYNYYNRFDKRSHWKLENGNYNHQISQDAGGHDVLFCGGSQLWYGKTMIPEMEGLGFSTSNMNSVCNGALQILSGTNGIRIDQGKVTWWCYRIAIPNVPATGALYVRVHPERSNNYYNAGYSYGDYVKEQKNSAGVVTVQGNYEIPFSSTDQSNVSKTINTTDGTNDIIYVVPGSAKSFSENITLYFNGVTIKKIAVSTDPKQVNKYGWATESREHDIDPALTSYMTGQDFRTFLVTFANYNTNTVTLTRIDNQNYLMPDAQNDEGDADDATYFKNACIIQNYAGSAVNILNGGFHLFVPDMHESDVVSGDVARKPIYDTSSSLMKAQLTSGTVAQKESGNANFAFTYGYYDADYNSGKAYSGATEKDGGQAFYRIEKYGASSTGHQGYLSISNPFAAARFTIVFADDEGDNQSVGIVNNKVNKAESESTQYYNLNGQQLNGQPTRQGLYVVNGKKIYVK